MTQLIELFKKLLSPEAMFAQWSGSIFSVIGCCTQWLEGLLLCTCFWCLSPSMSDGKVKGCVHPASSLGSLWKRLFRSFRHSLYFKCQQNLSVMLKSLFFEAVKGTWCWLFLSHLHHSPHAVSLCASWLPRWVEGEQRENYSWWIILIENWIFVNWSFFFFLRLLFYWFGRQSLPLSWPQWPGWDQADPGACNSTRVSHGVTGPQALELWSPASAGAGGGGWGRAAATWSRALRGCQWEWCLRAICSQGEDYVIFFFVNPT